MRSCRRMIGISLLLATMVAIWGCTSDNVSWVFVSNPSGTTEFPEGGAILIIRVDSGSTVSGAAYSGQRTLRFDGTDERGTVTVHLPTGGDIAILERPGEVEVRSTLLAEGRARFRGARLRLPSEGAAVAELTVPDASPATPEARGAGVLSIAASGTLLALQHQDGAWVAGADGVQRFAPGSGIEIVGESFVVRTPDGRITVLRPVPPPPADRRLRRPAAGQLEILGPAGQLLARVPADRIDLRGGQDGVFLTGSFVSGTGGVPRPFALTMADQNRYLLRTEF